VELVSNRVWAGIVVDGSILDLAEYPVGAGMRRCAVGNCLATLTGSIGPLTHFHGSPSLDLASGYVFGKSYNAAVTAMQLVQCSANSCAARVELPLAGFAMSASASRVFWSDGSTIRSAPVVPLGQPLTATTYRTYPTGPAFQNPRAQRRALPRGRGAPPPAPPAHRNHAGAAASG